MKKVAMQLVVIIYHTTVINLNKIYISYNGTITINKNGYKQATGLL